MKSFTILSSFLVILLAFNGKEVKNCELAILNVNLIDGTGSPIQEKVSLYIEGGKIAEITQIPLEGAVAAATIDGTGKYLIPGLIEGHAHPSSIEADPEARKNYPHRFKTMIHYGITTAVLYGGYAASYATMNELQKAAANGTMVSPRIYYSSPFITIEGAHPMKTYASEKRYVDGETMYLLKDSSQISAIVQEAKSNHAIGIKLIVEDGPFPPFVERMDPFLIRKVVEESHMANLPVYAHISDMEEVKICVEAGVDNLVHFSIIDWNKDSDIINKMAENGMSWVTTLTIGKSMFYYPLNPHWLDRPEIKHVYDSVQIADIPSPDVIAAKAVLRAFAGSDTLSLQRFIQPMVRDVARLLEKGVNVVLGTDVGADPYIFAGLSMHEEMEMMQMGGIAPLMIIQMATLNGAKMLDIEHEYGSLEKGKYADFILLTKNPLDDITNTLTIEKVVKAGIEQPRIARR